MTTTSLRMRQCERPDANTARRDASPRQLVRNPAGRTVPVNRAMALAAGFVICLFCSVSCVVSQDDPAAKFRAVCAAKAADGTGMAIAGKDGWLFLRNELRHIGAGQFWGEAAAKVSKSDKPENADPMPAILDFKAQMDKVGITLIVMPVPPKAMIYPEKLADGTVVPPRLDTIHQEFYKQLKDKGVLVIDLAEAFLKAKSDDAAKSPVYCKTDTHWAPRACEIAAKLVKAQAGKTDWITAPKVFQTKDEQRTVSGDLGEGKIEETLPARVVESADGAALEDKTSPIILLGDSHCLVFHSGAELHGTGAGLADQLAVEFGSPIDVIGVRGSGATPSRVNLLRKTRADAEYLPKKKVIVWCFSAREFTEATGWSKVPIVK